MTYYDEEDAVVPELTLSVSREEIKNCNNVGDYLKLRGSEVEDEEEGLRSPRRCSYRRVWFWFKLSLLLTCLVLLAGVFIKWVGPFFMDKVRFLLIIWVSFLRVA